MSVPNTKHLRKQKNKWMFRIKIPSDVQFAYDNKAVYYKTTGTSLEDIATAIRKRDLFLAEFNLEVADIRKRLSSGDLRTAAQILDSLGKVIGESVETVNIQAPELSIKVEPKN